MMNKEAFDIDPIVSFSESNVVLLTFEISEDRDGNNFYTGVHGILVLFLFRFALRICPLLYSKPLDYIY